MGRKAGTKPLRFLSPIHRATRQISIYLQARVEALGVSIEGGHVMTYLASYAPCTVGELSRIFGMSKSTLTGLLDRLAERSLLTRTLNTEDRRSFIVDLTPAGRSAAVKLRATLEALEQRIAERITAAELKGFQQVMAAIADVIQIEVRPDGKAGRREEPVP